MTLKTSLRRFYFIAVSFLPLGVGLLANLAHLTGVSGCGTVAASAPPVSLPAPVTGRLTVTSPDETGLVLVVGDDGAVPPDSLVHVANLTQDTTAFRSLELFLDLVPSAEAQAPLPSLCNRTFHACAFADDNGSFEVSLPAADDHDLIVEIIDADGNRISDRVHRPVPHNVKLFARPVTDLGVFNSSSGDHNLYALMGGTDTSVAGLVSVVNLDTQERTVVPFDGPLPARIAVDETHKRAIILDPIGEFAARVDLTANNFDAPTKLNIGHPRDITTALGGTVGVVTTAETDDAGDPANARFIREINLAGFTEGSPIRISALQALFPGATNLETKALDVITHTSPPFFDLGAFVGNYDVGGTPTPMVGLFDATGSILLTAIALPAGTQPEDVAFIKSSDKLLVSDSANDRIYSFDFISNVAENTINPVPTVISDPNNFLLNPRRIVVTPDESLAFVNAKNGTDDRPDTVLTIDLASNQIIDISPVGFGPSGLAFDPTDQLLYVGSLKSQSVTFWGLPDLLP